MAQICHCLPEEPPVVGGGPIIPPPLPPGIDWPSLPPVINPPPDYPVALPPHLDNSLPAPGTIWPPLDPSDGIEGKTLLLVAVVGAGQRKYRWVVVDTESVPQPK